MLSITVIVIIVAAVSGLVNVKTEESQLLNTMILGADQLSKGITSATWHAMLDDHREAAYQVMQTIALKQGIDRIRMFNRAGQMMFSTNAEDQVAQPPANVDQSGSVRIQRGRDGTRRLEMLTPIYNEPACSQAACHAHPSGVKVLGVLDLTLNLETIDREVSGMKFRVLLVTGVEITLISLFIIYFTRRFLVRPIAKLIEGTKAISEMDLDKPIDVMDSSEELDELARSFEVMRDRLRTALGEINQFTQNLETKVEERTQQLKAAQKKLLHNDRLASLGQLSASVAHEINNPISGVLNLSMLMQRMLKDDGVPPARLAEFRKYLAQVTTETARVGRIVSDLLAFSRRSKPQRAPADLNRIAKTTLSLVQHKMKLNNVELSSSLAEELPAAQCDASQIQQVVLNLLLNAAEATQSKSERCVAVETAARDGSVVLIGFRQRRRHPSRKSRQDIRSVLHHQIRGQGSRPRPGRLLRHHPGARRRHRGQEPGWRGHHVHRDPAGRTGVVAGRAAPAGASPEGMNYLYVGATTDIQSEADREALTSVRRCLARWFAAPIREVELPSADFAFDARRGQYSSIAVLEMLSAACPPDAAKLLAVTGRDLFIPVLTFVYGQAQLGGRIGVVSLARLRQEFYGLPHEPRSSAATAPKGSAARSRPPFRAGALCRADLLHVAFHRCPADRCEECRVLRALFGAPAAANPGS